MRSRFQDGALRNDALGDEAPQGDQQLSRHGDDGDPAHPPTRRPDARGKPSADRRRRLIAEPQPRQFDHRFAQPEISGLADALVTVKAAALPGAWGETGIGRNLAPVAEGSEQRFKPEYGRERRPNALELDQHRRRLRHGCRWICRRLCVNQGVALRLDGLEVGHDGLKAGNPRLRKTMIQVAWLWIRHQPGSAISQWFAERVGTARGRVRRIAIVAVARKLLVALWRHVTQGVIPEGAVLKA